MLTYEFTVTVNDEVTRTATSGGNAYADRLEGSFASWITIIIGGKIYCKRKFSKPG